MRIIVTENEVLQLILGIQEIQIDGIDWQNHSLHIYCSSIFQEVSCPHCLKERRVTSQTYIRKFQHLPITSSKEVYLHLNQRQFYCEHCDRHLAVQDFFWRRTPICII